MKEGYILTPADLDQIRNYPIDPEKFPLFFKMRERYVELWEHWQSGCRDKQLVKERDDLEAICFHLSGRRYPVLRQ